MKTLNKIIKSVVVISLIFTSSATIAQSMQFFKPNDQRGINVFETSKLDTTSFAGLKVKVGGNFTQDFQMLKSKNNASANNGSVTPPVIGITNGFNLAMANLNIDVQLADGIRMNLVTYLSTRHHEDAWVKGGYIQFDKLKFLKSEAIDKIMDHVTIKIGDFDVDYGDMHYRRTDGGNAIYNPFVENYIMDAFTTEIGGEIYYNSNNGFFIMGGLTNGLLNPSVVKQTSIDAKTGEPIHNAPAIIGKIGYDKQITPDFRFRLTGSMYNVSSSSSNTLYWGDRAGSHYFLVMEAATANATDNAWSGRFNPVFTQQVRSFMVNPFFKYKGLEFFGTAEFAKGRTINETSMRSTDQYAGELIYRFPQGKENFWIGGRFNTVKAALPGMTSDVTINRGTGSIGWFMTKNIALKMEYVSQTYKDFPATNLRNGGKFNGGVIEASIGF